ncbi:MAG: Mur ligase domain-containing protein, partial [Cyanobacteria bacterium J06635_11]
MTGGFSAPFNVLAEVLMATPFACEAVSSQQVSGITTDTRSIRPGELFIALEGDTFNGHDFAQQAIEKGAIALVVRKGALPSTLNLPRLEVEDTLVAYQRLGQWWRQRMALPDVALITNVGTAHIGRL